MPLKKIVASQKKNVPDDKVQKNKNNFGQRILKEIVTQEKLKIKIKIILINQETDNLNKNKI